MIKFLDIYKQDKDVAAYVERLANYRMQGA